MKIDYSELNDWQFYLALSIEVKQMKLPLKKSPKSPYYITNFRINGKIICRSTKETDKRKAYKKAEAIWQLEKGNLIRPKTLGSKTLSYAIDEWLLRLSKKGNPRNKTDIRHLECFRVLLGNRPLGKITRDDLIKIRNKGKAKGQSINRKFIPLMAVFNMAVDEGWIDYAPKYQKLPNDSARIKTPYTDEEIEGLIHACYSTNNTYLINPIYFANATGFRVSEIRNLKKNDVMLCRSKLILRKQKNGKENQVITLNSTAQTVLNKALLNPSEFVFYSPYTDDGSLGDFKKGWIAVREKANLLHKDFHTLRHTAITRVAKKVHNIFELQDYSRHNSVISLERYRHHFENKRAIAEYASFPLNYDATIDATV